MENTIEKTQKKIKREYIVPGVAFILTFLLFSVVTGGKFLSLNNLKNILNIAFPIVITSLGAVFIYAHGGIDFSLGPVQGLSILVIGLVLDGKMDRMFPALLLGLLTSLLCGTVIACLRIFFKLPALIASLCVQSIAMGTLQAIVKRPGGVVLPVGLVFLDRIPVKLTMLAIMVIWTVIIFEFTKIGKGNKAMGGNAIATSLMGINNNAMILFAHLLTNFAVGISAIFYSAQISQVVASTGFGLETDVLCAAVIGGMSLNGGTKSTIVNILVGDLIVAMMSSGFAIWGVNPNVIMGIKGIIFLVVLYFTRVKDKNVIIE